MPPAVQSVGVKSELVNQEGVPLAEPGAFFVTGEDNLRLNSWNSLAGVVLTISVRFLNSDGSIVPYTILHTPNTNRTKATLDIPLGIGFPLNVQVFASSGAPLIGQTFVQAQIIRGLGGATVALATLLQGYVTAVQATAWPGSPIRSSLETEGALRSVTGTTPAAGADINEVVPTGARWDMLYFLAQLSTSAAVANRRVQFTLDDGINGYGRVSSNTNIAANGLGRFCLAEGGPVIADATLNVFMLPLAVNHRLPPGAHIRSVTNLIDVADQWSTPQYLVREWLDI